YFSAHDSRWHFLRDGRHVHAQKGTEDALPETGPVALSVKALANSAPRVPYLHTVLRETALSLASISGVNLGFTTRVWQLRSPLHEVPGQTVLTLTLDCGQASTFELDYLLGLLKKALGIRELQGPDLGLGLVRLGAPVPGASLPREFLPAPGDEPAVICTKILGGEAWRMKANTPGAIRDLDSEFVHDLRVATRRARFACRLFGGMVGPEKLDAIKAELSWIAGLLGAVRDLDVLTARLESQLTRTDADQAFHANLARVLSERRGHARDLLVAGLGSPRYTSMLELLTSLPSQPEHGSSSEAGKKRLHSDELGRRRIAKALGKIAPWVRHDPRELPAAELHRFRILFKRLRYTAEFFRTIVGDTATTLAKECVRYQDCLGMHQDARVAIDVLIGMAEEPAFKDSRDGLLSLGALIQIQRDTMREIRDQLHELWDSIEGLFDLWAGRAPEVGA
ncbi:MAG TPA: CHAD domain-containing protein, partial [Spirochaetia bacterium]|nr:CHAD domain-containing protein [Spirochaetia bacterium]